MANEKMLAMLIVTFITVFLILASAPGVAAKKGSDNPQNPEQPEHPEHPAHPEHPEHPENPAPVDDGPDCSAPAPGESGSPVSYGVNEGNAAVVSDYAVRVAKSEDAGTVGISAGATGSAYLSLDSSSEASQAGFFVASAISSIISCVSLVSIFGKRPVPFITVWQLRDAVFKGGVVPRFYTSEVK